MRTVKNALQTAYFDLMNPHDTTTINIIESVNSDFYVYPNPANHELIIAGLDTDFSSIELWDISGRLINKPAHALTKPTARIDVSHLSPGIYFMRIQSGNKVQTLKFTIQR